MEKIRSVGGTRAALVTAESILDKGDLMWIDAAQVDLNELGGGDLRGIGSDAVGDRGVGDKPRAWPDGRHSWC